MIKTFLQGPWKEAIKDFTSFAKNLEKAAQIAIAQEAHSWAKEIRDGIRTQKSAKEARPPWPPLADSTLEKKKPKSKMLIETGTLMRSIVAEQVAKWRWLVGVRRGARSRDGHNLVNIAAVHEFGATRRTGGGVSLIPPRPFISPVYRRLSKNIENRLWERLGKEMEKHLKHKNIKTSLG